MEVHNKETNFNPSTPHGSQEVDSIGSGIAKAVSSVFSGMASFLFGERSRFDDDSIELDELKLVEESSREDLSEKSDLLSTRGKRASGYGTMTVIDLTDEDIDPETADLTTKLNKEIEDKQRKLDLIAKIFGILTTLGIAGVGIGFLTHYITSKGLMPDYEYVAVFGVPAVGIGILACLFKSKTFRDAYVDCHLNITPLGEDETGV